MRIQGYTGVYKGIQEYTRVYRSIQGYTGVYKSSQYSLQAMSSVAHFLLGTHRFEEPVSKMTSKG